ncbi:hypothetical protein F2Q68_00038643 [Brassica cretica]|uniref:Uncharacterized protein n=1 Tax=Brassica cretica TaxID=69181 RepID=A0A8S9MC73_BRACR|nr:hypothetical protein F2Q68_00038643 [Brassica cretica]
MNTIDKGKRKVVARDNKLKSNTRTKSCRKTLEPQFDGCLDDSSSEDEEDQAYDCNYEEESDLYKEQVYDCSSEESGSSDCETISCDPMLSPDTDQRSPNALPKEGCSKINTKPTASAKSTQIPKRTTSQKHCASPRRDSCSFFHRRDLLISHPTAISARTVVDVTYNCRGSQTAINMRRA